jgi:uncharacterized protein (DUF3820 family)
MDESFAEKAAADLAEIARMHMPFGKYGRQNYPPNGVPIYDLPAEYLQWFGQRSWPGGKLGRLLKIVYQMKADGSDSAFDPIRKAAGGRYPLRQQRRKEWGGFGD